MDYGLATYIEGKETLYTQQLIQLFYSVRLKYPPVPTTSAEQIAGVVTKRTINLPTPPVNDGGTIGWVTSGIRFPYDQDIDLGGPKNGVGYNNYVYNGVLTSINVYGLQAVIEITTTFGDPEDHTVLNFFKR